MAKRGAGAANNRSPNPDPSTPWALVWRLVSSPRHLAPALAILIVAYVVARVAGYDPLAFVARGDIGVQNEPADYSLVSYGVDDSITCSVNGFPVLAQKFTEGNRVVDITPQVKQRGGNTLSCRVLDDQIGRCYAWDFRILKNGSEVLREQFSCCNNQTCVKATPIVLDRSYRF